MTNVSRLGNRILVPYPNAIFPNRCIKTNQPVESADYEVTFSLPPHAQQGYSDSNIQTVEFLKILTGTRRVTIKVGFCRELQLRRKRILIGSLTCLIAGVFLAIYAVAFTVSTPLQKTLCVIGVLLILAGLALKGVHSWGFMQLLGFDGERLLFTGPSKNFLDSLPESK